MSAGDHLQIYRGIIDLTVTKFRDSDSLYIGIKETGYCILRSQLLMACHDKPQFRHLAMQVGSSREALLLACLRVHDMPQSWHLAMQAGAQSDQLPAPMFLGEVGSRPGQATASMFVSYQQVFCWKPMVPRHCHSDVQHFQSCRLVAGHADTAGLPPSQDYLCLASMLRVQQSSPCLQDPCHQLAWTLDSAIMQSHTALDAAARQASPAQKVGLHTCCGQKQ